MSITTIDNPLTTDQLQRAAALTVASTVLSAPAFAPVADTDDLLDLAEYIVDGPGQEPQPVTHSFTLHQYPTSLDALRLWFGEPGTDRTVAEIEDVVDAEVVEEEDAPAPVPAPPAVGDELTDDQGEALPVGSLVRDADFDDWCLWPGGWGAPEVDEDEHSTWADGPGTYHPVTLLALGFGEATDLSADEDEYTYVDTLEGLRALEAGEAIEFTVKIAGRELAARLAVQRFAGGLMFVDGEGKAYDADEVWEQSLVPFVDGNRARVVRA